MNSNLELDGYLFLDVTLELKDIRSNDISLRLVSRSTRIVSPRDADWEPVSLEKQSQINPKPNGYMDKRTIRKRFVRIVNTLCRRSISMNKLYK